MMINFVKLYIYKYNIFNIEFILNLNFMNFEIISYN